MVVWGPLSVPVSQTPRIILTFPPCRRLCHQAKIVDPASGEMVPVGSSGELLIRGYCVMLEYWEDLDKTQECITKDRWYKTG